MLAHRSRQRGFTLIELIVVFAIVAILSGLAIPMVKNMVQNSQIRSTADALQNALRTASSEAVRSSQLVTFVISASPGTFNGTPATVGSYWYYQSVPNLTTQTASAATNFLAYSPSSFAASGIKITASASAICYNSFGRQITNTSTSSWPNLPAPCNALDTTYDITGATGTRRLRVVAYLGGKVRMCDPSRTLSATNTDGC